MVRVALALALVAGCTPDIAGGAADGKKIFAEACATCHGPSGRPDETMIAKLGVRDLTAPEFRRRVTLDLVATQVRRGSKNYKMPAFAGALTEAQIQAVATWVMDLDR